ncbi:MAG: GNAT family N-acetyltransferase [Chitinophaga sp.]|uniref:GNAT family N-acetyltransferase n=1 Tax=Chitinophaga sp. TaxID=1869181 RepID=UPI0025C70178|nr:GNAT family N-acetyltransferase [Chitinophaga sp.]MBV8251575.1 GNAT family N-acetyltransferase [Chitinophaga sp.]
MIPEIKIAPVHDDASPAVINLIIPIQTIEFNVNVTLEDQPDLVAINSNYHAGGGGFWGVFADEELVGTIALINTGHKAGAIRKMFVKKEFRGGELRLAQRLLDHLIGYCREIGIEDLYLGTVEQLKAAHRFYERNGFQKMEMSDLPPYFPRMNADSIFYHLHI